MRLRELRRGANEFTIARSDDLLKNIETPTACLVFGKDYYESGAYSGLSAHDRP